MLSPTFNNLPRRITIVTPSFNQAQFLEETIRSVLTQGYPNLEYMVVDGGSTDGSVEIIRKYAPQLAYWTSGPDLGQADAVNKGWRRATGEILAYLNSDDTYCPGALTRIAEAFAQNPNAVLVFGRCFVINENSAVLRERRARAVTFREMLCWSPSIPQPGAFFRRTAVEVAGLLNPNLYYTMDYDLCLKIGEKSEMVFIPHPIANMRDHAAAKTAIAPLKHVEEGITVVREFFRQPRSTAVLERPALAALHLRKARVQCRLGSGKDARATIRQALQFRCSLPNLLRAAGIWALSLIGATGIATLRRWKRNVLQSTTRRSP